MSALLPPADLMPQLRLSLTQEQCLAAWFDLMHWGDELLLAGLRHQAGPDTDLRVVVRTWYAQRMQEHDRKVARMLEELSQREHGRGH